MLYCVQAPSCLIGPLASPLVNFKSLDVKATLLTDVSQPSGNKDFIRTQQSLFITLSDVLSVPLYTTERPLIPNELAQLVSN